jgi:large subunit ribosomal protein L29
MATKKFLELQEYSIEDLTTELAQTETQYQRLKFDHAIKGLDNPLSLREVRRDIARLKGEIRRREVGELDAEGLAGRSKKRSRRRQERKQK